MLAETHMHSYKDKFSCTVQVESAQHGLLDNNFIKNQHIVMQAALRDTSQFSKTASDLFLFFFKEKKTFFFLTKMLCCRVKLSPTDKGNNVKSVC